MREMKDSGVAWIGEIPVNWTTLRLKNLHDGMNTGEAIDKGFWTDDENDCIFYTAGVVPIHTNYKKFPEWKYTGENDILLARNGTPYVYFPFTNSCYTDHIIRVKLKDNTNRKYIQYSLQQSIANVVVETVSIATWSGSLWNEQFIAYPPLHEQQKIAALLDKKCTQIDILISNQEKQIEKLKAYKQSLITEVVTKGLNPDVPMKDSGYDFIGNIPISWNVYRVRNIGSLQNGISKGGEYFGKGFPFVSYGDIYKNFSLPKMVNGLVDTTEKERELYSVEKGDIFFTRTSETIEEVGFSCVCEETIENATFAGFVIRLRPYENSLFTGFAKYFFRSNHNRLYLVKEMNLVTRASLSQGLLKSMPVLVPPIDEQKQIVEHLDKKCSEIDSLIAIKQQKIEKLQQYKKSVIYEYVTGKKEVE